MKVCSTSEERFSAIESATSELIDKLADDEMKLTQQNKMLVLTNFTSGIFSVQRAAAASSCSSRFAFFMKLVAKLKVKTSLVMQAVCRIDWRLLSSIDAHKFSEFMETKYQTDVRTDLLNNTQLVAASAFLLFLLNNKILSEEILNKFNTVLNNVHPAILRTNLNTIHGFLLTYSSLQQAKTILSSHLTSYFKLDRVQLLKQLESVFTEDYIH